MASRCYSSHAQINQTEPLRGIEPLKRQLQIRYSPRIQVQDHTGRALVWDFHPPALSRQIKTHGQWAGISGYRMASHKLANSTPVMARGVLLNSPTR